MSDYQEPTQPGASQHPEYDDFNAGEPTIPAPRPDLPPIDPYASYGDYQGARQPQAPPPAPPSSVGGKKKRRRDGGLFGCMRTLLAISLMALAALTGTGLVVGLVIYSSLSGELQEDMATLDSLTGVENFEVSRIYDRNGVLLYEIFNEGRRTEVTIDEIPYVVRWATIATEDDSFYDNAGFDPRSIARAALEWYQQGEIVSGGSTITQQLVRQIVFDVDERAEQTLRRKLKEAALAWVMTQQYSKDEILALYLNEVYYGNLSYGIEGAANVYFDKRASELTVGEAAFLTGMIQSPVAYDPYTDFDVAKGRQRQVLDLLVLHGYLTQGEAETAFRESPLSVEDLASPEISLLAPHFTVEVRRQIAALPLDPILLQRGGLNIYTTLDLEMQDLALEIARTQVDAVREEFNLSNAALVAINPNTGEVLAMLGSIDYEDESIDGNVNVVLSPQQPGSTMKPFTYALILENYGTAADIFWDVPMAFDTGVGAGYDYEPVNYDGRFHGPTRLRDALANSYNIPAVIALRNVGVANLLDFMARLGVESLGTDAAFYGLSLTLGGGEITPLELASAYGAFANGGRKVEPYFISRVEDNDGGVLYERIPGAGEQVIDPRIAFIISDILSDNAARSPAMGPESELLLSFPAGAKTGTTNDYRDNWTVGFTPDLVVAVWAGNTDNSEMAPGTSGLTGAAPIWHNYMEAVYADSRMRSLFNAPSASPPFQPPAEGLQQKPVCVLSSLRDPQAAADGCPRTRLEWFLVGDAPQVPDVIVGESPTDVPTITPLPTFIGEDGQPRTLPPARVEIEASLFMLAVQALDEEAQAKLIEALGEPSVPQGVPRPNRPKYCTIPPDKTDSPSLSLQIFIAAPPDPVDAIRARNWAEANNVPIEPGVECIAEVIEDAQISFDEASGATYRIDSPEPNAEVYGLVPIIGTAAFDTNRFLYYKLEVGAGTIPDSWLTFGETHDAPVQDDVLEILHADALAPGQYVIRLALVRVDGNFLPPYQVQITVVPPP